MTIEPEHKEAGGYDPGYRACDCFWGKEPGRLVREWVSQHGRELPSLRVLDAGAGEGKNAALLAAGGAAVTAVELSAEAIRNGRRAFPEVETADWRQGDIRDVSFPDDTFDLVVAYGLFHCLEARADVETTVQRRQRATVPGGYHLVVTFNDRLPPAAEAHPGFSPCLLPHDAYLGMYGAWNCERATDEDLAERHPDTCVEHKHSITRLTAHKPHEH